MRRLGPEFQRGWRERVVVGDIEATIEARHVSHNRLPRGHEIARQAMSGRGYSMVSEDTYEWFLSGRGVPRASIRLNPNGTFSVGALHQVHRSVQDAAKAWLELQLRRRPEPKEADPDEGSSPAP